MNLGESKIKSIREKMDRDPFTNKNLELMYMKKMMKNRTKTDTDALLKNISMIQEANSSDKKVKRVNL